MDEALLLELARFSTGNYADAFVRLGLRGWTRGLAPLGASAGRVVGRAVTALYLPSRGRRPSGLKLYDVMHGAGAGAVLVVAAPYPWCAVGGMMCTYARRLGLGGMVLDGYVRDREEILATGLGVWCRGVSMGVANDYELAAAGVAVDCAGAQVRPGDLIVADGDGVLAVDPADLEDLLPNLRDIEALEGQIVALVRSGASPRQVAPLLRRKGEPLPGTGPGTR